MAAKGNSEFEMLVKKAIAEEIEDTRVEPPHHQFEAIMAAIETQRGKKRLLTMGKKLFVACAMILVISTSLYLVYPDKLAEAGKKLFATLSYVFVQRSEAEFGHPYLKDLDESVMRRLLQAQRQASFAIKLPTYLPAGYILAEVSSFDQVNDSRLVLIFASSDKEIKMDQEMVSSTMVSILQDSEKELAKKVYVLNLEGMLVAHDDGVIFLSFVDEKNVHFMFKGQITEEELIKVANSLHMISF